MRCAWQEFMKIVPAWMRADLDKHGMIELQELRLRVGLPPELVTGGDSVWLSQTVAEDDIKFVINTASRYSPWAAASIQYGFLTIAGGHRIGICGEGVYHNGKISGIKNPTSLCIRVAKDLPGIAANALQYNGSILIIGRPGSGKTTLLRDLIRQRSDNRNGCIAVVDERGELFPTGHEAPYFYQGRHTDVLYGCRKKDGIDMVLRTMSPDCIAIDEITAQEDCEALLQACWSGVELLATAHASDKDDLLRRTVYRPIITCGIFHTVLIMQEDKSWRAERIRYGT